ncbi:hypothetical protein GO009_17200 [Muricauda sp. TY007]|uniref:DUF5457 domain-containing protein n=1 Tax=Allomuricauda sp. TY007 TaxID=2683200 RepID=UPI0013C22B57|nr:DUF5457 domain-containing protein [Muricauda sp. TY007]NDV17754.1 hypothetical protein [Muricauda sp. TY007]
MSNKKVTGIPLHEVVLKIMYLENVHKAAEMAPKDVLWRINNPEISERQIREVLDWLVLHKKVNLYLGKYSLDRVTFLEQMELYEEAKMKNGNRGNNPKMYYVTPIKPRNESPLITVSKALLLIFGLLTIAYSTYSYWQIQHPVEMSPEENIKTAWKAKTLGDHKNLYVSDSEEYDEKARNAISYSFFRQNAINDTMTEEVNTLNKALDSITQNHHAQMADLRLELQRTNNDANTLIKNLALCNLVIIILFGFLYLERFFF